MKNFPKTNCMLRDYLFYNLLQLLLGGTAIITLIRKRQLESPQRQWHVWIFDVGKQITGRVITHLFSQRIHIFNFNSNTENKYVDNLIYLFVDSTLGLVIVYFGHHLFCQISIYYFGENSLCSKIGYYRNSPNYKIWLVQLIPYLFILLINKRIIILLLSEIQPLLTDIENQISQVEHPYKVYLFTLIMIICPWILYILQLVTFDTILGNTLDNSQKSIFQEKESSPQQEKKNIVYSEKELEKPPLLKENSKFSQLSSDDENSDSDTKITI